MINTNKSSGEMSLTVLIDGRNGDYATVNVTITVESDNARGVPLSRDAQRDIIERGLKAVHAVVSLGGPQDFGQP